MTAAQADKVPVTILAGFLGAGKTTLLNRILSGEPGVRVAVLVNDFGAIDIDARLITRVEGETVSLANGCICCTIRDDLAAAIAGLLDAAEPPQHILTETSGVSEPASVAMAVAMAPRLATRAAPSFLLHGHPRALCERGARRLRVNFAEVEIDTRTCHRRAPEPAPQPRSHHTGARSEGTLYDR